MSIYKGLFFFFFIWIDLNWNVEDDSFYKNEPEADIEDEKDDNESEETDVLDLEKRSPDPKLRKGRPGGFHRRPVRRPGGRPGGRPRRGRRGRGRRGRRRRPAVRPPLRNHGGVRRGGKKGKRKSKNWYPYGQFVLSPQLLLSNIPSKYSSRLSRGGALLRVLTSHKIGLGLISLPGVTFWCSLFLFLLRTPIDFIFGSVVFVVLPPTRPLPAPYLLLTNWALFNAWFQATWYF